MTFKAILPALILFFGSLLCRAQVFSCRTLMESTQKSILDVVPTELLPYYQNEVRNLVSSEVRKRNAETLRRLDNYVPEYREGLNQSVSLQELQDVLPFVRKHEVVGTEARELYARENAEIGYCFGRAAFIHLLMTKMGLQKDSIMKVWAVGEQQSTSGEFTWGFHVAPLVFVKGYGWMVLDSSLDRPQHARHWFSHHEDLSTDKKLRFYITGADKFGVNTGRYSRFQMGLDLKQADDWYKHYFVNMMKSIAGKTIEQLGFKKIKTSEPTPQKPESSPSIGSRLQTFIFGF